MVQFKSILSHPRVRNPLLQCRLSIQYWRLLCAQGDLSDFRWAFEVHQLIYKLIWSLYNQFHRSFNSLLRYRSSVQRTPPAKCLLTSNLLDLLLNTLDYQINFRRQNLHRPLWHHSCLLSKHLFTVKQLYIRHILILLNIVESVEGLRFFKGVFYVIGAIHVGLTVHSADILTHFSAETVPNYVLV